MAGKKGMKRGSRKNAKANGAAAPTNETAPADHNQLSAEQERALFFHHFRKIKAKKDELASISGELRSLYKIAKAEGFTKKDIDYALALEADDEAMLEQRRREQRVAAWMNHPIGTQPDMFAIEPDRTPSIDRAFEDGQVAGMKGLSMVSPHAANTEQGQKWIEGWHKGQEAIFAIQRSEDARAFADIETGADESGGPAEDEAPADEDFDTLEDAEGEAQPAEMQASGDCPPIPPELDRTRALPSASRRRPEA